MKNRAAVMMDFRSRETGIMMAFRNGITVTMMIGMVTAGAATGIVATDQTEWAGADMRTGMTDTTGTTGMTTTAVFIKDMTADIAFRLVFGYGV